MPLLDNSHSMKVFGGAQDGRLLCKNGHVVDKLVKLKRWQGHLHGKECSVCGGTLDREEARWRCEKNCTWNVCHGCYDAHWTRVIKRAEQTENESKRLALLKTVPQARRRQQDFLAAELRVKAGSPTRLEPSPKGISSQRGGVEKDLVRVEGGESPESSLAAVQCDWATTTKVLLWTSAAVGSTWVSTLSASAMLCREDLAFPHYWLVVGFANLGLCLLCRLALKVLNPPPEEDPEGETEWKDLGVLGLMYGFEYGLGALVVYHATMNGWDTASMLTPVIMFIAGILASTDQPAKEYCVSVAGITLGAGMMATRFDWHILEMFPFAIISGVIMMFRWVFTKNIVPDEGGAPLVLFAARMTTATAAVGFEMAFVLDFSCYRELLSLPHPGTVAMYMAVCAVGCFVKLLSELHLSQLTSVTALGFMRPILDVGVTVLALLPGGKGASFLQAFGVVLSLAGIGYYCYLRNTGAEAGPAIILDPPDPPQYIRMQAEGPPLPPQRVRGPASSSAKYMPPMPMPRNPSENSMRSPSPRPGALAPPVSAGSRSMRSRSPSPMPGGGLRTY